MQPTNKHSPPGPATVAIAVAIAGSVSLLLVDYGPWSRRPAEAITMLEVGKTAGVVAAAGAVVSDTAPVPPARQELNRNQPPEINGITASR